MTENLRKVIKAFRQGFPAKGDYKETCSTDGNVIFSYRMPIARRTQEGPGLKVAIVSNGPSMTTRKQISALRFEFRDELSEEPFDT